MERFVKMDFKRFIKVHKLFDVALILGVIIALNHFVEAVLTAGYDAYDIPGNAYISWLGGSFFYSQSFWFYFVLPLVASVAVGIDYGILRKKNYFYQYRVRMTVKKYVLIQGLKVFSLGFFVVVIPLVLSFVLTMMERPLLYPDPLVAIGPLSDEIGAELFYVHPMVYTVLYILFDGLFAGAVALFTVELCVIIENYFIAIIIPFAIYYLLYTMDGLFDGFAFQLNRVLTPVLGVKDVTGYIVVFVFIIFSVIGWVGIGRKEEL